MSLWPKDHIGFQILFKILWKFYRRFFLQIWWRHGGEFFLFLQKHAFKTKILRHDIVPFQLETLKLQVRNFIKKVLHHRCFLNDFVKLFRTGLIDCINPLSSNPTKWSRTLKQFVGKLPTNCFSVFDHFVGLLLKGLTLLSLLKNDYVLTKQTNTQQANVRVPNIY